MELTRKGAIVVGLDPSDHARAALRWADREAALRDAVLRIGHAWMLSSNDLPEPHPLYEAEQARQAAHRFLDEAAAKARADHPGLKTETVLIEVDPVGGLLQLAESADLVVVGRRGMNRFLSVLLGSVSEAVVAHTPVPAVIVPVGHDAGNEAPVVVGVPPGVTRPVEFAFAEAELRGVRLAALRSRPHPPTADTAVVSPLADETERDVQESAELKALLAPARRAHPGVEVDLWTRYAPAEQALVDASADAALVVVGAHRRHGRFGLPVGRVTHHVLHGSLAPVAVVPGR